MAVLLVLLAAVNKRLQLDNRYQLSGVKQKTYGTHVVITYSMVRDRASNDE